MRRGKLTITLEVEGLPPLAATKHMQWADPEEFDHPDAEVLIAQCVKNAIASDVDEAATRLAIQAAKRMTQTPPDSGGREKGR